MTKRAFTMAAGMLVTTALLCGPIATTAAATAAPVGLSSAQQTVGINGWSAEDWREIAERARAAGDLEGADVSIRMAERVDVGGATAGSGARNIWTTIAKKAVIQALRYGVNKLPAKIRPYVNRIINVVEEIDQFQQGAVVLALTKAGVPYDVAVTAAQWIVIFVGL